MPLRRTISFAVLAAAIGMSALAARRTVTPGPAVIGVAYPFGHQRIAALAQATADSMQGPWPHQIEVRTATPDTLLGSWAFEVAMAAELASLPNLAGVVGHGGSRASLMAAPIYNGAGIPQIVPTGTSRRLRTVGPWTFTLAPNDSVEGEFIGRYMVERLAVRKPIVFYTLDEYGAGLRDGAVASLRRLGAPMLDAVPVLETGRCDAGDESANDYASAVDAALLDVTPDVVLLATRGAEGACLVGRLRQRDPAIRVVAGDGLIAGRSIYASRLGNGALDVDVVAFWHPDLASAASRAFVQDYRSRFGSDPSHDDAMVYDALLTMIHAIRTVGPERHRVRQYLESLGRDRPALTGVTGPITFPSPSERLVMIGLDGTLARTAAR